MSQSSENIFYLPSRMIGRETEMSAIKAAIEAPPYDQVFYLHGAGGIGKTRILIETDAIVQAIPNVLATGIIDLYHGHYHQSILLLDAIAQRLESRVESGANPDIFSRYRQAARRYRLESTIGESRQRQPVDRAFLHDYREIALRYPIVLLIDTFEKLHPIIEGAEQFNFSPASRLEAWLVDLISRLPNTLTILAGRPRTKQHDLLKSSLGSRLTAFPIEPFSEAETTEFVDSSGVSVPADVDLSEIYAILHNASGGRPVILALALASARMMNFDTSALPPNFREPYPANSAIFVDLLLKDFNERRPDLARLLMQTFYLRKGLSPAMLRQLRWIDDENADQAVLNEFRDLPFVKVTGDNLITLHDEAYEFLFGKLVAREETDLYRTAIAYLDARLEPPITSTNNNEPIAERPSDQPIELAQYYDPESVQKRQMMQIERLFYQLSLNPVVGYQEYRTLCNNAIRARDEDFDAQLQDELARFFEQGTSWGDYYRRELKRLGSGWDQIVFDEGVRWVDRRLERHVAGQSGSRYLAAIDIADRVKQAYPTIYLKNPLARYVLDAVQLSAETYQSRRSGAAIVQDYAQVTQQLEQIVAQSAGAPKDDLARLDRNYATFVLASAYNRWGYYERKLQHLDSALPKYKHAARLFKELGPESDIERAITLNNLGYALSQQGHLARGLHFVEEAARLALALGSRHRFALSLNTMAQIKNELNRPDEALQDILQARQIFTEVKSRRDLALCARAEGDVRRWLAYRHRHDWPHSRREYERAIKRYQEAMRTFDSPEIGERLRRIEVRQGLGCAHRSRGKVLFDAGKDCRADMDRALHYLYEALELARQGSPTPIVSDLLEDIAVVYVNQDNFAEAIQWLQQARAHIPESFQIVEGEGLRKTEETLQQSVYWLRLGQIEFQYALSTIASGQWDEGCRKLLCACAYIRTFSPQAPQLAALHSLGKYTLVHYVGNVGTLNDLRAETYWAAQKLRVEDAFNEIDQIFDQAIEDIELL